MFENLRKYQIYLVSGSPRRRELLQKLGIPFHVRTMEGIDELPSVSFLGVDGEGR